MALFCWTRLPATASQVDIDQRLPWPQTLALGMQYLVVMLGATVAPLLMGFDVNLAMLMCGVATLLFYLTTGGQVPSFMGCSSVFVGVVLTLTAYPGAGVNDGLGDVLGGVIACGLLTCVLGVLVRWLGPGWMLALLPPVVNGTILLVVGTSLATIPVRMHGGAPVDIAVQLGTATLLALLLTARRRGVRQVAVVLALLAGTLAYAALVKLFGIGTPIALHTLQQSAWFGLPALQMPRFHLSTILTLTPLMLVLAVETLSHVRAVGDMTQRDLAGQMGNALIGDGLGTMVSGSTGGPPMTSYAENIGIMSATRVYSTAVLVAAGLLAVLLGLSPVLGAVVRLIPTPVLGGVVIVVFGMIAVAGVRMLLGHAVNLEQPRNQVIIAVPLMLGAGHLSISAGQLTLDGITVASIAAIVLHLLIPGRADH